MLHTTWSLALGLINSNGTARHSAAPRQIKINLVPKVIVPKGHEKKGKAQKAEMATGTTKAQSAAKIITSHEHR